MWRCKVSGLTEDKWRKVDATRKYGISFQMADRQQRKQAAYDLLEDACKQYMEDPSSAPENPCAIPEETHSSPADAN